MDDVEYILRIILKARDDMAAVLAKARRELRGFTNDADKMNAAVTNLNQAMKNFDNNMDNITKKLQAWRAVIRDAGDDNKKTAESLDSFAKSADKTVQATKRAAQTQEQYQQRARALRGEIVKLDQAHKDGAVSADFAAKEYKKLATQLNDLSLRMSEASRKKTPAAKYAEEASAASDKIVKDNKAANQKLIDDDKRTAATRKAIADEILAAGAERTQHWNTVIKQLDEAAARDHDRVVKHRVDSEINAVTEIERVQGAARKRQEADDRRLQTQADRETNARQRKAEQAAERDAALQERIANVTRRAAVVRTRVAGGSRDRTDVAELRRIAAEQDSIARAFAVGTDEARMFNREAEHSREVLRDVSRESTRTESSVKKLSERFHGAGSSVAGFDNQLRGMGILAAVVSLDQLISAAIALGGELVSLAGSAVMAGGALGGILAAGAAQALPVLGLLAGAFQRVKAVGDAFQQSQLLQKAQFADAEKGAQKQIDKTNALANAQDAATAANDNLADSRKALTEAQKEGTDQLEDLILAEKQAALAAKGAALDVKSAQEALRLAISGGASQLEIDQKRQALAEAQLSRTRAGVGARRATADRAEVGGDINKLPNVEAAQKAMENAQRSVDRTSRALDVAADKTDRLASSTMTAQANLNFLLSQMAPAERKLYTSFQALYTNYKRIFSGTSKTDGIYGTIIDSFTRAVDEANKIIQMPKVIKSLEGLSKIIGDNISKVVDAVADPTILNQMIGIIDAASENLGPVVDILIDLGKAFLNIAETANPAFQKLLEYIGPVVDKFLALTGDKGKMEDFFNSGEEHLESWLDLVGAIIGLFAALVGASAGSGKKSIDDLTDSIKGWTDWIQDHRKEVVGFFEDARKAAYAIGGVLENLAVTLGKSFSAERVEKFAKFLEDIVIPTLADVIDVVGRIVDKFIEMADNPFVGQIVKLTLAFLLFTKLSGSILGVFGMISKGIGNMVGFVEGAIEKFKWLRKAIVDTQKFLKAFALQAQVAGAMTEGLGGKLGFLGKAMTALGRLIPFMFGPWGLLIAAVIVGVVLLLKHFGKLTVIWDAIKKAASGFMKDIEPAVKSLQDALDGLGIKIGSFQDVLKGLEFVGKALADFITTYIIGYVQGLFKILAGVVTFIIRTIAGVINVLHGLADILIGIFTLDGDQIKKGFKEIVDGIVDIFWGIVDGLKLVFEGMLKIWLTPFKAAWGVLTDFFGDKPKELGESIIDGIINGIKSAGRAIGRLPGWIWDKIKDGFHALGGAISRVAGWLIDKWLDFLRAEIRGIKRVGNWIWNAIKDSIRAYANLARAIVGWLWDKFTDILKREIQGFKNIGTWIYNALSDAIHGIGSKLEDIGKRLIDAIVRGIKAAPKIIKDAVDWLMDQIPGAKELFKVVGAVKDVAGAPFAEGGPVPGSGSGDTVRARLTPGEHVLTKGEVAAAGGHDAIFALRRMLGGGGQSRGGGFAVGGAVGGSGGLTISFEGGTLDDFTSNWKEFWGRLRYEARSGTSDIERQFRDMRVNTARSADRMYRDVRGSVADIQNSFDVRGKVIVDSWSDNWLSLMKVAYDGLNYIGHETNRALSALGEKHINFGLSEPKKSDTGKAVGGWIGSKGQRGKDRGFYALGAGEAVLNWQHQPYVEAALNAQYGFGLGGLFDRVRGYHAGGPEQPGFAGGGGPNFGGHPSNVTSGIAKLIELLQKKFPLLQVTSTTDHSLMTTSGNISDHTTGHAVDLGSTIPYMARVVSYINSSGLWKQLKQGIHNPGLAVNRGERVDGPGFFTAAWPQHIDHIHLALAGVLGHVAGAVAQVARRLVTPTTAAASKLVQKALDKVRNAANAKVDASGGGGDTEGSKAVDVPENLQDVNKNYPRHIGPKSGTATFSAALVSKIAETVGLPGRLFSQIAQGESGFSPGIQQPDPGDGMVGYGLWQMTPNAWGKGSAAYKFFQTLGGIAAMFNPFKNARMAKYLYDHAASKRPNTPGFPWYGTRFVKATGGFAGKFDEGGTVPGQDGTPTPILAHAGEWILNKGQQVRAAMLAGLSVPGLKSMLGFWGGGSSFAGGGVAKRITRIQARREADLVDDTYQNLAQSFDDLGDLMTSIRQVSKLVPKRVRPILNLIELATKEGGFLDQLRSSIERSFATTALRLRRVQLSVGPGNVVTQRTNNAVLSADEALTAVRRQRGTLVDERGDINAMLKRVTDAQKRKGLSKKAIQDLAAREVDLRGKLADANERVMQNTEDIFNAQEDLAKAQEEAAQARKDAFQKTVDDLKNAFTKRGNVAERAKRVAAALGDPKLLNAATDAVQANLTDNINQLSERLSAARAAGYTDIAEGLEEDIAELNTQVLELAQQRLRDAMDAISTAATRRGAVLDLFGRMADAMGVVGQGVAAAIPGVPGAVGTGLGAMSRGQVAQARISSAQTERAGYVNLLGQAQAAGNVGLSQDLIDKINELTVVIVEQTKAERDNRFAATQEAFDYSTSLNDLNKQLVEATDAVSGQTSSAELLRLAQERLSLQQERTNELQQQYNEAVAAGDVKASQDLQKALLESKIAVQQNTKAVNDATGAGTAPVSYTSTAWQWFRSALLTGTGGVLPQYTPPVMADVGGIGPAGMSSTTNNGATIQTNIEINEAGGEIDATQIASTVVFAQRTAQN